MPNARACQIMLLTLVALITLGAGTETVTAHDRMLPLEKMAGQPERIFVGTVRSIQPERINKTLIITNVTFDVHATIVGTMPEERSLRLRQFGGTVDGQSIEHNHLPDWRVGESYLVFQEDPALSGMVPTYGGETGYYRLVADATDPSKLYPVDVHDRPIGGVRNGLFHLERPAREINDGVARLSFAEPYMADLPQANDGGKATTATFEETAEVLDLDHVVELIQKIRGERTAPLEDLPIGGTFEVPQGGLAGLTLCWCGWHNIFLVFEQVPSSWGCYSNNESAMAQFNKYIDLIRYTPDNGTWGPSNGDDELTGFPDNAQLLLAYGSIDFLWDPDTVMMCVGRSGEGCDRIREADIHVNPDFSWRYKFADAFNMGENVFFYRPVMMHEMGHALALETGSCNEDYLFDRNTIMSRASNTIVETGKGLHRRDAKALRLEYDDDQGAADTISLTDLGVESWYMDGEIEKGSIDQTLVQQGDTIDMRNLVLENMSTRDVSGVRIRCFFSRNMTISESDWVSPTVWNFNTVSEDEDWRGDLEWKVPNNIPPGEYYVGVMVTHQGSSYTKDSIAGNNTTFFPGTLVVEAADPPTWVILPFDLDWAFLGSFYANSASGAENEEVSPQCPGGRFGRSQFFATTSPISGKLVVGPSIPGNGNNFAGATGPAVALWTAENGLPGELVGVACGATQSDPAVFEIEPQENYLIQVGNLIGQEPYAGWMNVSIEPDIPVGSAWEFPIEWSEGQNQQLGTEYGPTLDLPCIQTSTMGRWYAYTAPTSGLLRVATCNAVTNFPSVVSIHKPEPFTPVIACGSYLDSDCDESFGADARAEVVAGERVLIRVASAENREDALFQLDLTITPDEQSILKCDTARTLQEGPNLVSGTGASVEQIPICEEPFAIEVAGTWGMIRGVENRLLTVSTCADLGGSSDGEVEITLFGGDCGNLIPLACNNYGSSDGGAQLAVGETMDVLVHFRTTGAAKAIVLFDTLPCTGDLNGDGIVDGVDLAQVLGSWGQKNVPADIDGNGTVDGADLAVVLGNWGLCN